MYRKIARKNYLNFAKSKKRNKKIRKAIKQLQYICRDFGYIDVFVMAKGVVLIEKQAKRLEVIKELYWQP